MAVIGNGVTDPASRIEALVSLNERAFKEVFNTAVQLIQGESLEELAALLEAGKIDEALAHVERAGELMGNAYGEALARSARNTAQFLTGALTVAVSFDGTNFRAVEAATANRYRLVREFSLSQREALNQSLARSIAEGINPIDAARRFRETVGLTARQEAAVANYRRLLTSAGSEPGAMEALTRRLRDKRFDSSVARAVREGVPLTQAKVNLMVSRYRDKYVRYRSEVIARTEALRATHQGSELMYAQAIESGDLEADALVRTWITAKDERVRHSHRRLNGLQRPVGGTWPGDYGPLRHPGDPDGAAADTVQCRCVLTTRINPEPTAPAPDPNREIPATAVA